MEAITETVILRHRIIVRGAVQGVGFRPFVHRLAGELGLSGWVMNSAQGVVIEIEGEKSCLDAFARRLRSESPPRSLIREMEISPLDAAGSRGFEIRQSDAAGDPTALVPPDIATCPECLEELFNREGRRFLYPFTTCTNCGPRYSIIDSLPCDRANSSMRQFPMCDACRREYENLTDRRYHAQAIACPACGPKLSLWHSGGGILASEHEALLQAAAAVRRGDIVAVKGLGGFQLLVDARNDEAVLRLRRRKMRDDKPFALMYPALKQVAADCLCSPVERRLLLSPESPILLLNRRENGSVPVAPSVAPGNDCLGIMLPYTPLHHILTRELGFPVVATSGNRSDEPICTDEHEALDRLGEIADLFLVHDRPIRRHVDDSVVQAVLGRAMILRRARGYAPLPIRLHAGAGPPGTEPDRESATALAVGAHQKSTVALVIGDDAFLSQHLGDLETKESIEAFRIAITDLQTLHANTPEIAACDLHPDYHSTHYARGTRLTLLPVQHHAAHIASCMAEHHLEGELFGVSWDGTGYGPDGTIWGGEFLTTDGDSFDRAAHFRTFRLPGGEQAVREPRRTAAGILHELFGDQWIRQSDLETVRAFDASVLPPLCRMLGKGLNSPLTSSAGRLFDAVASLTGVRQATSFEGQAAMELERLASAEALSDRYPVHLGKCPDAGCRSLVVDWEPMFLEILRDLRGGFAASVVSAKFHNALVESILRVAGLTGRERVVLTGGCFQNRYLLTHAVEELQRRGFRPSWNQQVPPNDGGIALGQAWIALRRLRRSGTVHTIEEQHNVSGHTGQGHRD
jgi:hydrogenase maturation protein HypF